MSPQMVKATRIKDRARKKHWNGFLGVFSFNCRLRVFLYANHLGIKTERWGKTNFSNIGPVSVLTTCYILFFVLLTTLCASANHCRTANWYFRVKFQEIKVLSSLVSISRGACKFSNSLLNAIILKFSQFFASHYRRLIWTN